MSERVDQLMPCPFCGARANFATVNYGATTVRENGWEQYTFHYVNCEWCGGANNHRAMPAFKTKAEAAAHWNRREVYAPKFCRPVLASTTESGR